MHIIDWSSDVCSSDLRIAAVIGVAIAELGAAPARHPDLRRGETPVAPLRATPADDALEVDAIIRADVAALDLVVARFAADRSGIAVAIAGTRRSDLRATGRRMGQWRGLRHRGAGKAAQRGK